MDKRNKPTVINLANDIKRKSNESYMLRNRLHTGSNFSQSKQQPHTFNIRAQDFDIELKNDFQWLLNFNLKDILIHDIEEESRGELNSIENKKTPFCRENKQKQDFKFPLHDIVEQCLSDKNGVTVREIFKWISGKYPCFKAKDCKWKNLVRKILHKNPIFKNKKPKSGRSDFWYLHKNYSEASNTRNTQIIMLSTDNNAIQSTESRQFEQKSSSVSEQPKHVEAAYPFRESEQQRPEEDDTRANIVHLYPSESWIETSGVHGKDYPEDVKEATFEYYELQMPLATDYLVETTVDLGVASFLDENKPSITLELL